MPSNTPSHTLAISEAAETVGVTIHSLRRWCEWHGAYLSPGANPAAGQARRLTGVDIEVLRHVKALRSAGLQTIAINEQLAGLTFAEIDTEDHGTSDSGEIAPAAAQAGLQQTQGSIVAPEYFMAIERRFEALEAARQEDRRDRLDRLTMIGLGFCGGLLVALIIFVVGWLYGG
jgi:DNA-binding transcriptional MerR regulator